jgi:hypothetical protein
MISDSIVSVGWDSILPGNLQSYWTTTKLWKLTVVLDHYEAKETYSRIGPLRSYGNLQSYLVQPSIIVTKSIEISPNSESIVRIGSSSVMFLKRENAPRRTMC